MNLGLKIIYKLYFEIYESFLQLFFALQTLAIYALFHPGYPVVFGGVYVDNLRIVWWLVVYSSHQTRVILNVIMWIVIQRYICKMTIVIENLQILVETS